MSDNPTADVMHHALRQNVQFSCGHLPLAHLVAGDHPACPTCHRPGYIVGPAWRR